MYEEDYEQMDGGTARLVEMGIFPMLPKTTIFKTNTCFVCGEELEESEYLSRVMPNKYALRIANNITHYRHNHIASYNRAYDGWNRYTIAAYADKALHGKSWDNFKAEVNNRAKRQIARAVFKSSLSKEEKMAYITEILRMQNNDEKTVSLVFQLRRKLVK